MFAGRLSNDYGENALNQSPEKSLTIWIAQYKELVVVILVLVGGFSWIVGYFATKEQVEILRCLINENISMVESRMHRKILIEELARKDVEVRALADSESESEHDIEIRMRVRREVEMISDSLRFETQKYQASIDRLRSGACESAS